MNGNKHSQKNRRLAMIISGITDAVLGAAIVLIGLGFFPIDIADYGFPLWAVLLVGGVMFIIGVWVAVHNYSRMDE